MRDDPPGCTGPWRAGAASHRPGVANAAYLGPMRAPIDTPTAATDDGTGAVPRPCQAHRRHLQPRLHVLLLPVEGGALPGQQFRMSDDVLELYIHQLLEAHPHRTVTIAWQGGEPTLMGIDFFRRAVEPPSSSTPGQDRRAHHPDQRHAARRRVVRVLRSTTSSSASASTVRASSTTSTASTRGQPDLPHGDARPRAPAQARRRLQHPVHGQRRQPGHPLDVYRFFRDELGAAICSSSRSWSAKRLRPPDGDTVTERSVERRAWGCFLTTIFDEWVVHDVGTVFVPDFDAALATWFGLAAGLCIFDETAATRSRSNTTATCTPATTSSSPTTCSATSATTHLVDRRLAAAAVRRRQARHPPALLPRMRRTVRLPRRVPEEPLHLDPRR